MTDQRQARTCDDDSAVMMFRMMILILLVYILSFQYFVAFSYPYLPITSLCLLHTAKQSSPDSDFSLCPSPALFVNICPSVFPDCATEYVLSLVNMRLKSIIDPHYSQSQFASGKALVEVLTSEEYYNVPPADYRHLLECFCLSISSLTRGFPADENLDKFIYATAAVFSDPEQDEAVVRALLEVIVAGYKKLQNDLIHPWSTEQELHGTLFRHLYVTVKRLERILTRYNEMRGQAYTRKIELQPRTNLHVVSV